MFQAENGDAFLLGFDNGQNILIDMGMPKTYEKKIKPELLKLKKKNQDIDLLVITHIDEDHIGGALEFIKCNKKHKVIQVNEVWINTYKHLQFAKQKVMNIDKESNEILKNIIKQNEYSTSSGTKNISYKQGSSFSSLVHKYKYNWNTSFHNKDICILNNSVKTEIKKSEINFILLSPNKKKLDKLSKKWLNELESKKYDFKISDELIFDDAFEFYMKFEQDDNYLTSDIAFQDKINFEKLSLVEERDKSVTNGSSISFIIEYRDKKLLFLGDSHEDIIYDTLLKLKNDGYELFFDVMKVSHHASNKNISNRLISLIDSKKFLISTDGTKHNHPNIEALSKIITKKTNYIKELIFNYDLELLRKLNNAEHKSKYNYEIKQLNEIGV